MDSAAAPGFAHANPHALAVILEASRTRAIIATRDIFDISGTKLWARDQPVSQALQRRLMDRRLRHPLEACLQAEDGVTARTLQGALDELLEGRDPIAEVLRPQADGLVHAARHLPVHPVAQLLLTAGHAVRPASFRHAVQAMALTGALASAQGADTRDLRAAMLAGLLHDLGELYVAPAFCERQAQRSLDVQDLEHLVVHPHLGRLLIEQLTHYPADVSRAVAEHHERLDGSGYPLRLTGRDVSPLGRLLSVAEATLSALHEGKDLSRAAVSLRLVPGEFDLALLGPIVSAGRPVEGSRATPGAEVDALRQRLQQTARAIEGAAGHAEAISAAAQSPALRQALSLAVHLLERLRAGWIASGMWQAGPVIEDSAAEVDAVEAEVRHRLASVGRAARLRAGHLEPADAARLEAFCDGLAAALAVPLGDGGVVST